MFADGAAYAEEEGVDEGAVAFDLFPFEADVGDPVLAAGVGAAGDVELDLLVEGGEALLHLFDEPFCECFGFGDGELAELGSGAGYGSAPEGRGLDVKVDGAEFGDEGVDARIGDVGDEDVLGDGGAEVAVAELLGEIGEFQQLVA